jgi:hypothetical protein
MECAHADSAQRVDLLDHVRQEGRDESRPCRPNMRRTERREATTLLLAWLPASAGARYSQQSSGEDAGPAVRSSPAVLATRRLQLNRPCSSTPPGRAEIRPRRPQTHRGHVIWHRAQQGRRAMRLHGAPERRAARGTFPGAAAPTFCCVSRPEAETSRCHDEDTPSEAALLNRRWGERSNWRTKATRTRQMQHAGSAHECFL